MKYVIIVVLVAMQITVVAQTTSSLQDDSVYTEIEKMPEFKGGREAMYKTINQNIYYPPIARRAEVQGTSWVSFIVEKDGTISDVKIQESLSKETDEEAMRVVSLLTTWIPGEVNGQPVRVRTALPIKYKLLGKKR